MDFVDADYTLTHGGGTGEEHVLTFSVLDDDKIEEFDTFMFWDGTLECTFTACPLTLWGGAVRIMDDEGRRVIFRSGFE